MRTVLFTALTIALALPAIAKSQARTDFTVDPAYTRSLPVTLPGSPRIEPRKRIVPRILTEEPEFFEPRGSRDGEALLGLSASRFSKSRRTEVEVSLFGQFEEPDSSSPYRSGFPERKQRKGIVSVRWKF